MRAAPDALLDDGLLEVVVLEACQQAQVPDEDPAEGVQRDTRARAQREVFRAREVTISADRPFTMYADGDPIGELPVRVRALPGAVTCCPRYPRPSIRLSPGPPPFSLG